MTLIDADKVLEFIKDCKNELVQLKVDPFAKYWFRQGINRVEEFIQLELQLETLNQESIFGENKDLMTLYHTARKTLEQELHAVENNNKEQKEN